MDSCIFFPKADYYSKPEEKSFQEINKVSYQVDGNKLL